MTGLSISGDRFLAVSQLKQQLAAEVEKNFLSEAIALFKVASRAKALELKGVHIYSSYSKYMNDYEDVEGFLVAFEKVFLETHARKTYFLKEESGFVEVYDEFCHGSTPIVLAVNLPKDIDLYNILKGEAATLADLFF